MVKIDDRYFVNVEVLIQFTIGSHVDINLKCDIAKNPDYYTFFINKYDSNSKFDIYAKDFIASGCHIKAMDISFGEKMNLSITSDYWKKADIQERREEIINELINNNYEKEN
jgi:hypothetical protein